MLHKSIAVAVLGTEIRILFQILSLFSCMIYDMRCLKARVEASDLAVLSTAKFTGQALSRQDMG
jgi:hypothetical protein